MQITNTGNGSNSAVGGWSGRTHNISTNPEFVSTTDYYLQAGSLGKFSVVKKTFGSKDGVWEYLQDAIGEIVSRKDTVMSYLQFCQGMTDLSDESNFGHFRRLVDFYFYILNPSKVTEIESALDSLEKFLAMNAVEHGIA